MLALLTASLSVFASALGVALKAVAGVTGLLALPIF